jgi:hypothetical protein
MAGRLPLTACLLIAAVHCVAAWWENGHMLVANVALSAMQNTTQRAEVEALAAYLGQEYPMTPGTCSR